MWHYFIINIRGFTVVRVYNKVTECSHLYVVTGIVAKTVRATCQLTNTFRLIDFKVLGIVNSI